MSSDPKTSEITSFLTEEVLISILRGTGCLLSILPALVGMGYGLIEGTKGICKGAEYTINNTNTLFPLAFISAPPIYSLICFFTIALREAKTIETGIRFVVAGGIDGLSGCFSSYAIGCISRNAVVTKSQQKKFAVSFYMLLIFGEVVGLLGLICAMILVMAN
ncbi:Vacuolar ATP synthase 16 kDa proteolipid subunit [Nosema bombycis CQ1]|jgi:V-type H+-transporting ATPase proteolipid subunit|uniref:Vacuolar ATP synthase 16 kDa proteolipid subunit n=1 Tax=Nosema bombycis (strain CQ1 / CVCC 102059) TaxID=578461 RepID=R0KTH3_NOSB1|nr:Vacuolar ATP synthase 16 kDa proteolipid subunit [Nosema bombycis CQ1]|eukprot:EOB13527.1 Vacuolar ATP synthase 16 kDa proteolipid subunit [Nosema bombycis CQ1]